MDGRFPLIPCENGQTGCAHVDATLRAAGLEPDVLLTAIDAAVIKTHMALGLGMCILAAIAAHARRCPRPGGSAGGMTAARLGRNWIWGSKWFVKHDPQMHTLSMA